MATSWGDQTDEGGYTDEEEEKKEEGGGGNALGGFMFGNVDRNLRLEENYLDQDAIDKLGELGARLGGRLNLQRLVSENHRDEEDDDYDVKAENARDYEDEQEVIDDPGALQPPLPNFVLPLPQQPAAPGAEEDDYDDDGGATELPVLPGPIIAANVAAPEEEDYDEEGRGPTTEKWPQVPPPEEEDYDEEGTGEKEGVAKSSEGLSEGIPMEEDEEALEVSERPAEAAGPLELPVLFQKAGGEPVLRFSEIFSKRVERSTKRKKKAVKKRVQIQVSADHEESDDDEAWFRAEPRAELRKEPSADLARQPSGEGFKSLKQRGSFNWRARRPAKSDESEEEREAFEPEPDEARSSGEEGLTTEEDERRRSAADITEGGADVAVREHDLRAPEGISAEGLGDGLLEGRELMDIDDERRASHLAASTSADVIIRPRDGRAPKGRRRGAFGGNQPVRAENGEVLESLRASLPEENFALVHQVDWERNIMWDDGRTSEAMRVSRKKNPRGQEDGSFYAAEQNGTQSLPNGALSNGAMSEEESELTSSSLGGAGKNLTDQSATLAEATEGESVPPVVLEKLTKDDVTFAEGDVNGGAHPQMLRLEKRAPGSASERAVSAQELLKRMTRLELGPEDWLTEEGLDLIKDGLDKPALRAKLVLDLNDPDMVFEVRDGDKEGLKVKAHAAAIVLTANSKERPPSATLAGGENQQAAAAPHPGAAVRFNVSNDRFYQTTQVKKTKARQRAQETRVKIVHSVPALKLQTSRPTPLLKEMANFHRPRAVWFPVSKDRAFEQENGDRGQIRLVVKSLGNIGKSVTVRVKGSEALEAVRGKVMSKWKDVKKETLRFLHAGKEITDGAPLTDQSLRHDSIVHLIRTKVHPLLKANKLPKSEQPSRPPGAFKKKVDLTAKDGHVLLMEYAEERPPLLSLPGMGARLATYYRKRSSADGNAASLKSGGGFLGQIVPLEPAEPTPFLGQVPEGQSVTSLETSLYRAPAFRHKVPTTDFVLIRSNHGKLSLRKATGLHLVGQEEPSKEVMVPNSKAALKYSEARLQLHVFREFTAQLRKKKGGEHAALPMHDLARQFPGQAEQTLRKWLRPFAQFTTLGMLRKKPGFIIPQEDELRRMVAPEQVCMFEAMKAGQEYLRRAGISVLTTPGGIPLALEQIAKEVDAQTRELADYIHRELQLTPWNLTASFLTGMEGRGQMELSGLADPSGRGQGFSYLRLPARKEEDELGKKKKALLKEKEGKLTGTDADLRRLSMAASRQMLLNFGVREADIPKNRWRRIEMVRKFSSAAALEGRAGATANKFARGSRLTLMQQQEIFMKKAQEIWDAQLKALADEKVPEEAGSDGEGSDMDSFAKELEAALEEGDKDEEVAKKKDGSKGFGRGRQALQARVREEQLEDEEAEAEELRKMLQEDDEQVQGNTDTAEDKGEVEPELPEPPEAPAPAQQLPKVVKVVRIRKVDGKEVRVEEFLRDPEKIAEFYREKEKKAAAAGGSKGGAKAAPGPKPGMKKKVQRTGLVEEEDEAMIKSRKSPFKGGVKGKKFGKGGLSVQTTGLKHRGGEGTPTPKTGGKGTDRVCLKCGQVGHMSTNRACPMYNADGVEGPSRQTVLLVNEAVRVEGTKVAISRKKPPGAGGSFGGLTPKVVDAPRRAPSTLVSLKRPRKTEEESTETEPKPKKLKGTLSFVCRAEGDVSGGQKRPAERSQASPPEKKQRPQPNRKLNREFYRILKRLEEKLTESYPFLDPVDEKLVPDYYDIITRPMCLTVMKEKALKAAAYKSVEELVADMELIRANAHTYNYEGIPPQADRLFDAFMTAVEAKRSNLEAIAREKPGLDET